MRYYLDTNILIFILANQFDEIDNDVLVILEDYSSILYTSNLAMHELLFLYRIGKLEYYKYNRRYKSENDIVSALVEDNGVEIIYFNRTHFKAYKSFRIINNHKDMNDHAIIAQAISDKIPLISSDQEFHSYTNQGLNFIFNKR